MTLFEQKIVGSGESEGVFTKIFPFLLSSALLKCADLPLKLVAGDNYPLRTARLKRGAFRG